MTYKKINIIKSTFLILFSILILMHNFKIKITTRNKAFFSVENQKKDVFILNKTKTKDIAKIVIFNIKPYAKNSHFLGVFTQVSDYFKRIQSRSVSSMEEWVLSLFERLKGLLETTKVIFYSSIFSLKHRFFWLKNQALIAREKLVWLLERNFSTREATLGKAFVFADLSGAPESLYHSFKVIGILHLIAASSANIYLILSLSRLKS